MNRTLRFPPLPALLGLVLVLLVAACGSDAEATPSGDTGATATAETESGSGSGAGSVAESDGDAGGDSTASTEGGEPTPGSAALVDSDHVGSYTLVDDEYGTMVTVTVDGDTRTIVSNSLPDHETGEFPNSGNPNTISEQSLAYDWPAVGTYTGNATFAQTPGVAVNGIAFEPGTGETVSCASGETYRIEALQDTYDLGLDVNNAHVQPGGQYHYHGVSQLLVDAYERADDLVHIGFAADGFLVYYSKSGAYSSGYALSTTARSGADCVASGPNGTTFDLDGSTPDGTYNTDWVHDPDNGDLDECNGITIDGQYAYLVTDEYPFIGRCLNGEFSGAGGPGGGPGQGAGQGGQGQGGPPDFSEAADALGIDEQELLDALGGPPPDLEAAAERLGITVEELTAVLPPPPGG